MGIDLPAPAKHIRLTSHHPIDGVGCAPPIRWGAADAAQRGPVIGTTTHRNQRNVIGSHSGSYGVYRALAVAAKSLTARPPARPDEHVADRPGRSVSAVVQTPTASCRWIRGAPSSLTSSRRFSRTVTTSGRRSPSPRRTSTCPRSARRSPPVGSRPTASSCWRTVRPSSPRRRSSRCGGCRALRGGSRLQRGRSAARAVRGNGRHVSGARHARRPRGVAAADRRADGLRVRRSARSRESRRHAHRARARRMQRLGRVRLRHLHVPAVPDARDRGVHTRRAGGRRRARRLLPQGRPRARRGDEVPRLQRAQAPGRRRQRRPTISCAPNAWPACRTCASRS